ncbi:MAG: hypothetical protein WAV21_03460 [Minisyncoccia bacterium]
MRSIADVLKSHPVPGIRLSEIRLVCAKTAEALTRHKVAAGKVTYKDGVVSFSVPPVVKTELFLREHDFKALLASQGITVTKIS